MSELDQRILDRLQELSQFGESIEQTKYSRSHGGMVVVGDAGINAELAHQWGTNCLNLLSRVSGSDTVHYRNFKEDVEDMLRHGRQFMEAHFS